jgi:3-isopropylmalate dehydrogenase
MPCPTNSLGPEVTGEAVRVLETIIKHTDLDIKLESKDFGGAAIDSAGDPLPEDTLKSCQEADAILLGTSSPSRHMKQEANWIGAVGGPKWGVGPVRPEQGILRLRKALDLYANIRPANFASEALLQYSPLKPEIAKGTDIIVLRELVGGLCRSFRSYESEGVD